jgi:hypothetical protein
MREKSLAAHVRGYRAFAAFSTLRNWPQALKRPPISNGLAARVELVPFPKSTGREFFRRLPGTSRKTLRIS